MRIEFNKTGTERKELASAIAEFTEGEVRYLGAPTFSYQVDTINIDKNGCVSFDDGVEKEYFDTLVDFLAQKGFEGTPTETPDTAAETDDEEVSEETEKTPCAPTEGLCAEHADLTVTIPLDCVAVGNLTKLLDAKGTLIKKALGVDDLKIEQNEYAGTVSFPWFSEVMPDEVKAYTHFITALCKMSKDAKRVTAKEKDVDNEKYAFRCFLLRLGFIGAEYKAERKILLRNLDGSSAFKAGRDGEQK